MRKLLVVVDMQNDFIDGSLGTAEAVQIVDNVVDEIGKYDVKDVFWGINEKVAKALGEAEIIDKPTFGSRKLAEKIEKLAEKEELEVTLIGLCTDICVVSNALLIKAYLPETPVKVIAACCAGVTPASHEAALTTMKMCQVEVL